MPKPSDVGTLIERCVNGDSAAWTKFIANFSHLIYWAVKNKIKQLSSAFPETEIHDICQHILLSIWGKHKLENIKDSKSITAWLVKVAQNETIDYLKSRQLLKQTDSINETDISSSASLLNETYQGELNKEIEVFIGSLPLKDRRIAILDLLYNLKRTQISEIVNLPVGTISPTIKRVKADLKQHLLKKGYEF